MQSGSRKPIHIIAACSENRIIGRNGTLPWRIKEDLQYLYDRVSDGVVIEGRRVWDELKKPFPNTRTIVLTRNETMEFPGAERASSLPEAIERANGIEGYPTIWIGGGEGVYRESLDLADRLYLTLVHGEFEGDTYFPDWTQTFTHVVSERRSSNGKLDYTFLVLEKNKTAPFGSG